MKILARIIIWTVCTIFAIGVVGAVVLFHFLTVYGNAIPDESLKPPILISIVNQNPILSIHEWENQKKHLIEIFEKEVYGTIPKTNIQWVVERRILDAEAYHGSAVVEEIILTDSARILRIPVILVTPKNISKAPLIIASNFCANHNVFPEYDVERPEHYPLICDDTGLLPLKHFILGKYIQSAPVEDIVRHGFAFASFYTGSVIPDAADAAPEKLITFSEITDTHVTGVLSAWAWGYIQIMRVLETDPRIDSTKVALYGHSRDGKAALLAGAFDESVDMVIAHQSGTGGARPSRRHVGESVEAITDQYPFWFDATFKTYASRESFLTLDQHFLVALIAPRPLLITGARHDQWADPVGSFMSLREATHIYNLYDDLGLTAETLTEFIPKDTAAFFMRPLNHGVRASDWNAFLAFMSAHF